MRATAVLPVAPEREVVVAPADGWLRRLDARAVGVAAWRLGAGRARKEDPVQAGAGVERDGETVAVLVMLIVHVGMPYALGRP